ncbi:hypothetical protein [Streptomyces sp. NPDC004726]
MVHRDSEESPLAVTYEVATRPSPLQVSQGSTPALASVDVILTNHRDETVSPERVVFSFPVGDGPGDLTANPGGIEPRLDDSRRWRLDPDLDRPGTFLLEPKRGGKLEPGEELEVTFAHIQINPAVGTSRLTVTETVEGGSGPKSEEHPLAKVPAGFTVGDFRPEYILVDSGESAVLTWRGENRPGAAYTMLHAGEPVDVTQVKRWESPPLHQDTAFTLVVEVTVDGSTAEYALNTLVTVARPDLMIRHLTVGGRVVLTPVPVEFALDDDVFVRECTAETDGFLIGHVLADEDITDPAAPAPTLAVTVTAQGTARRSSVQSRTVARSPEDPGSGLTALVPRGAAVRITRDDRTAHTHRLAWIPFGTGELRTGTGREGD